jgi:hypothetical protein
MSTVNHSAASRLDVTDFREKINELHKEGGSAWLTILTEVQNNPNAIPIAADALPKKKKILVDFPDSQLPHHFSIKILTDGLVCISARNQRPKHAQRQQQRSLNHPFQPCYHHMKRN